MRSLLSSLLLASVLATACVASSDKYEALIKWVESLGGQSKAEIKINHNGVRGLFAKEHVKQGENIVSIPASAIINAGGLSDSFAVPTLIVLKELKSNCSRFGPYLDIFPSPEEVVNSCNMDARYVPMWKSSYWEKNVGGWQSYLVSLLSGAVNPDIELTLQEAVGNVNVTLKDLEYACAISSTRYVAAARRKRLIMAPIYDMANHIRECVHSINSYEESDFFHVIAGKDVVPGEELCYSYGALRDDYAVAHYGFLPDLEDPPRLSLVDHRDFKPDQAYDHETAPAEEPFVGSVDEMVEERNRLAGILSELLGIPDTVKRNPGEDYVWDMLKGLEQRRINSLRHEINRLNGLLEAAKEL